MRRRHHRAIDIAAPSRHRLRCVRRDLATPSASLRPRHRRAVDLAAPSTSPRCRPSSHRISVHPIPSFRARVPVLLVPLFCQLEVMLDELARSEDFQRPQELQGVHLPCT